MDRKAATEYLDSIIVEEEAKRAERAKKLEQYESDVRAELVGKTITGIAFDDWGQVESLQIGDIKVISTSSDRDAENYGEPNRLWIAWPDEEEVGTTEEPVV